MCEVIRDRNGKVIGSYFPLIENLLKEPAFRFKTEAELAAEGIEIIGSFGVYGGIYGPDSSPRAQRSTEDEIRSSAGNVERAIG
jgi:hypothetical protein